MQEVFGKLLEVSPMVWVILGVIVVLSVLGLVVTANKNSKSSSVLTTKKLVYGGMCIAIAFILSYIRIYKMPQGGSITLASMFPIILYAMVFGTIPGIIAGTAYGLLQLIQDAWVLNWAQLLFDYPLAYGFLGLAGLAPSFLKNLKIRTCAAVSIAILGRGLMHFLSGVIFFADSAPEGQSAIMYSLVYNGSYIIPELIITLILSALLVSTPIYSILKTNAAKRF
ncbi:MAG: thiT [Clostridia bacterium]|jgi:thiamine transporter|nr:thiT [Clostridia bacterium]